MFAGVALERRVMLVGHWFVRRMSIWAVDTADLIAASEFGAAAELEEDVEGRREEERKEERLCVLKVASDASSGAEPDAKVSGSWAPPNEATVSFWDVVMIPDLSTKTSIVSYTLER